MSRSPDMGLEPMTLRLKVWCSTDWANRAPMKAIRFFSSPIEDAEWYGGDIMTYHDVWVGLGKW